MAKKSKFMKWLPYLIITALIVGGLSWYLYAQAPVPPTTPTTPTTTSTISMTDFTSREILDELCPVTVYGDKGKITDIDERYDITFYETVSTEVMPDDFDKDLSEYDYIMIRVNPDEATDGYWTTYDYWYPNSGNNFEYRMYAYHEATDVYGSVLNIVGGTVWDLALDGNYTIPLWYPTVTKTELHHGTHFDVEDDLADLSQTTLDKLWNEQYYRSMPTLYADTDDIADHDKIGDYQWITETFAIKFEFNTTVSIVDANPAQVNLTATCDDADFQVEYAGTFIYFVTTESWNTLNGNFNMFFEIEMAVNITCDAVYAGRIAIPDRLFTGVTFTSLETLLT